MVFVTTTNVTLAWQVNPNMVNIIYRMRNYLGDFAQPFKNSIHGDGNTTGYDLPYQNVDQQTQIYLLDQSGKHPLTSLQYVLDSRTGHLDLVTPPAQGQMLVAEGISYGLFTDQELEMYANDALAQHTFARDSETRYLDPNGFIKYHDVWLSVDTLPYVEMMPVALLSTIEALWALCTDASLDIDVSTADGTHIPRSERFDHIQAQITSLQDKYDDVTTALNIGLYNIENFSLRRVSYTTGRLVPSFRAREYDDTDMPQRLLPVIDARDEDTSGIPSPVVGPGWGMGP